MDQRVDRVSIDVSLNAPIGRTREASVLHAHVEATAAGGRRGVLLLGDAGVGKSTLLRWLHGRCESAGLATAMIRVPASAGLPPLYPVGDVLAGIVSACGRLRARIPEALSRLEASLRGEGPRERPMTLPDVAEALDAMRDVAPVAVLVDDLHWAPPEGMGLLLAAMRVAECPLVFAAGARTHDRVDDSWMPPGGTSDLPIEPLEVEPMDESALGALAAQTLGAPPLRSLVETLRDITLGNPLFAIEALREWRRVGLIERMGAFWGLSREPIGALPGSLREMVAARAGSLNDPARLAAAALAVLVRDARFEDIASVSELPTEGLVVALSHLEESGFVVRAGDPPTLYRLAHPLYEAAAVEAVGSTRAGLLHERALEALRGRGARQARATAAELAHHAILGLREPEDILAVLSRAAGEADGMGSYEEAARWYAHLADRCDAEDPTRLHALERRALLMLHFDPRGSIEVFDQALEAAEGAAIVPLLRGRATAHQRGGDLDRALEDLNRAEQPSATRAEIMLIRHARAVVLGVRGDLDEAEAILTRLLPACETNEERARVTGHLGTVAVERGDVDRAILLGQAALEAADEPSTIALFSQNVGWQRAYRGEWAAGSEILESGIETARRSGDVWSLSGLETTLAIVRSWQGRFAEAYDLCLRAREHGARLRRIAASVDVLDSEGWIHLEAGSPHEALRVLADAAAQLTLDVEMYEVAATLANLAEAYRQTGDISAAQYWIRQAETHSDRPPIWKSRVERVRAHCLADNGDFRESRELLEQAIDRSRDRNPYEHALCLESLVRLRAREAGSRVIPELAQVALTFEGLGAKHAAERCWAKSGSARAAGSLPARLTAREQEIATIIGEGSTDRDIARRLGISVRTASKHVSNILAKLGFERRTQIAAWIHQADGRGEQVKPAPSPRTYPETYKDT